MEQCANYSTILESTKCSPVPYVVFQLVNQRVQAVAISAGFCAQFGFDDPADAYYVMNHDMYRVTHPDDVARVTDAAYRFASEGGNFDVVYRNRIHQDNDYRIIHAQGRRVMTADGAALSVVWYTIEGTWDADRYQNDGTLNCTLSQLIDRDSKLYANHFDSLTGLPNMTHFFLLAETARERLMEQGIPTALLFVDITGMKHFNRKYGYAEGDSLIRAISRVLIAHFGDESCGRLGQDHFAVLTRAENLEDRLKAVFKDCRQANQGRVMPVRVGIYTDAMGRVDISSACDRAKMACDINRKAFRSVFQYFSIKLLNDLERRQYIIDNLDRAIASQWIQVYHQPIVRAANGRVSDEEALSRWVDPVRGFMCPGDFIPVLEETKLIYKLDLYVVDQILAKMRRQMETGLYVVPESVNLSRTDFDACDIVEEVCRRVDAAGISRNMLTIEITESTLGKDFNFMKAQIERFRELGFKVWIDDFGSGYSSLDVLQSIRFDLIKLDMRFMQQFDSTERSRIILTELIKMAIGLGIETVAEGVERQDQVDFLREIGCMKLQGFYYTPPISLEALFERYRNGTAIGFENPRESEYYAAIGRINLYDLAVVANDSSDSFSHYFDTMPMAVLECTPQTMTITRCNKSYRVFMERSMGVMVAAEPVGYDKIHSDSASTFVRALQECCQGAPRAVVDEDRPDGSTVQAFVRRIAVNPVTGVVACAVVVLAVTDVESRRDHVTFAHIARALSSDYFNLFYVNLDSEFYTVYSSDGFTGDLSVERHGDSFFAAAIHDARTVLYCEDQESFIQAFSKEKLVRALDTTGAFTLTYRQMVQGAPTYVSMKAVRMPNDASHIIIGVSNVDAQMRHQEALERIRDEQATFARNSALAGDFIAIYAVDPETSAYVEYSATPDYEMLGLAKQGEDFFEETLRSSRRTLYLEDLDMFQSIMTRENVLDTIHKNGIFTINYRLMIGGEPKYVILKASIIEEKDGPQLIVGVNNIDAQVKRDQEYASKLSLARSIANLDALTGVKNKHAYIDVEAQLNSLIEDRLPVAFAIVVFDVNGLKQVNDTLGHQAGDQFLKDACAIICNIFKRSPVFRVGGDEFAVIAQGYDYDHLDEQLALVEESNLRGCDEGGIVIACGVARFDNDRNVSSVFERADQNMYINKALLKGR